MVRWKNMTKKLAVAVMAASMMLGSTTTAFAFVDPSAETETVAETETETETETVLPEETEDVSTDDSNTDGSAFTVPGNAEVQDDITDDSSKEFLTIQTKNNNTFYLIIDRSATTENVYMLSKIDENDLEEFLEEADSAGSGSVATANPSVVLEEQNIEPTSEAEDASDQSEEAEEDTEKKSGSGNTAGMIAILAVALCGIGAYYYFKIYKPRTEEDDSDDEGMEIPGEADDIYDDQDEED